jgi:hypothetical protein
MNRTPSSLVNALASGDSEQVNDAIDDVDDMDPFELVEVYDDCFDQCEPVFDEAEDGYVRQSVVRFLREAYPMLELKIAGGTEEERDAVPDETMEAQRYRYVEFLFRAIEDDDGRVRKAAIKGIDTVATAMSMAEFDDELTALVADLEALEDSHDGQTRKHIEQAHQTANRMSGLGLFL